MSGKNPSTKIPGMSRAVRLRLAVDADCDERTVAAAYLSLPGSARIRERIVKAAISLGLAPPPG